MQQILPIPSPYLIQKIHPNCFKCKEKILLNKNLRHDEPKKLRTVKEEKHSTYCPEKFRGKILLKFGYLAKSVAAWPNFCLKRRESGG